MHGHSERRRLGFGIVRLDHAESAGEGRGATFTVELPLTVTRPDTGAPEPVRRSVESETVARPVRLKGLRILVVDDEADARELMRMVLGSVGAHVETAACAAEALAQLERWRPDILVSDIGRPDDDGYVLIRTLREREGASGRSTPAIAVTAYARAEDRTRALSAGFQLHVAKPLEPTDFVAAIASLLHARGGAAVAA